MLSAIKPNDSFEPSCSFSLYAGGNISANRFSGIKFVHEVDLPRRGSCTLRVEAHPNRAMSALPAHVNGTA